MNALRIIDISNWLSVIGCSVLHYTDIIVCEDMLKVFIICSCCKYEYYLLQLKMYAVSVQTAVYVDETPVVVGQGHLPCRLATPEIIYTSKGPTVTLSRDLNIPQDEEVWVGYAKTLIAYEYIGML